MIPLDHYHSILEYCAKENSFEFNMNKAMEEAIEFQEALIKYQTKPEISPKRPDKKEILKEYIDFIYRGYAALLVLYNGNHDKILDEAESHLEHKMEVLSEYKENKTYVNGL